MCVTSKWEPALLIKLKNKSSVRTDCLLQFFQPNNVLNQSYQEEHTWESIRLVSVERLHVLQTVSHTPEEPGLSFILERHQVTLTLSYLPPEEAILLELLYASAANTSCGPVRHKGEHPLRTKYLRLEQQTQTKTSKHCLKSCLHYLLVY